jgi:hypothetical protein
MAAHHELAHKYPLLVGYGQFGSRHNLKAGSPRYVGVGPSPLAAALFPAADRWHLPYVFVDGERAEPAYFVPVYPLAAVETYLGVTEGWNHRSFGRREADVDAVVDAFLAGDPGLHAAADELRRRGGAADGPLALRLAELGRRWPLALETAGFAGPFTAAGGAERSAAVYELAGDRLRVTCLPYGVATDSYKDFLVAEKKDGTPNAHAGLVKEVRVARRRDAAGRDHATLEVRLVKPITLAAPPPPAAALAPGQLPAVSLAAAPAAPASVVSAAASASASSATAAAPGALPGVRLASAQPPAALPGAKPAAALPAGGLPGGKPAALPAAGLPSGTLALQMTAEELEAALGLAVTLTPNLTYLSVTGGVLEFGRNYLAPVLYWAPLRQALYAARVEREAIVLELKIFESEQIVAFAAVAAELDLARVADDEAAAAALAARAFPRLDSALIHSPKYTPAAALRGLVTAGPGASYDYLLNLRERDLVQRAVAARKARIVALQAELVAARALLAERPVPCATLWRAELAAFRAAVARGRATAWTFSSRRRRAARSEADDAEDAGSDGAADDPVDDPVA